MVEAMVNIVEYSIVEGMETIVEVMESIVEAMESRVY